MKIKKLISKFLVAAMLISAVPMNSIADAELVYFENQENAEGAYEGAGEWAEALTDDVVVIDQEAAAEKKEEVPAEEGEASVVEIVEAAQPETPVVEETPAADEVPAAEDTPAAEESPVVEAAPDSEKAAVDEWGRTDEWSEPAGESGELAAAEASEGEIAEAGESDAGELFEVPEYVSEAEVAEQKNLGSSGYVLSIKAKDNLTATAEIVGKIEGKDFTEAMAAFRKYADTAEDGGYHQLTFTRDGTGNTSNGIELSGNIKLSGDTVLPKNAGWSSTMRIYITGDTVIDLNGYTLMQSAGTGLSGYAVFAVDNGKTLTITDSSSAGTGKISAVLYAIQSYGNTNAKVVINGGTIATDAPVNGTYDTAVTSSVLYYTDGQVTLNGGKLEAPRARVDLDGNEVTVAGNELIGNEGSADKSSGSIIIPAGSAVQFGEGMVRTGSVSGITGIENVVAEPGYVIRQDESGNYICEEAAAKIGDTLYVTLEAAIEAVSVGETIAILKNIDAEAQVVVNKQCTIDLNGNMITYAGETELNSGVIGVKHGGDLTIKDSSGPSTGAVKSGAKAYAAVAMTVPGDTEETNAAKLTLVSGTLEGHYYGITGSGNSGRGNTEITINGGTVKGTVENDNTGIFHPQAGSLTVTGGTVEGAMGIYVKAGNPVTITGGTIVGIGAKGEYIPTGDGFKNTGDALVVDNCGYPGGEPTVSVTGGTFRSINGNAVASYAKQGTEPALEPVKGFVSGGIFETTIEPVADLCAEGYQFVKNADGTYGVESTYEAKIGETKYATIAAAVEAAKDGDTIILLSNVKLSEQLCTGTKKFTLDLNGKEISYTGTPLLKRGLIGVNNGGDLTIKDSSVPSTGVIRPGENAYGAVAMTVPGDTDTNVAKLTLESGTLEGYYYGIVGNGKRGNTSVTITGGSVVGTLKDNSVGIYNPQAGSLTVTDGTVEGAMGIYVKAGNPIEIKGGTVIGNGAKGDYVPDGDGTKNTGDALVVDNCGYPGGVPGVSVSGGTFRSTNGNAVASYAKPGTSLEPVKGFVSGGTYNKAFDEELCVSGYELKENGDGTYGVVVSDPLVKIVRDDADVMYPSLEAAIADVQKDEIIILLKDIETKTQILVDKPCIIDLNGKKITYAGETELNSGVIGVKHGGDLTINDSSNPSTGAIKSGTKAYAAVAMTVPGDTDETNAAKLTLVSGTLEGSYYGITGSGNVGRGNTEIVVDGGTVKGTALNDNAGIYHPQAGKLTIAGGTVEGATGIYVKAGNPVTITGGAIVGNGAKGEYTPTGDGLKNTGDGLVIDNCGYPGGEPGVSVTGGTFKSTNGNPVASYAKTGYSAVKGFISGGTYNWSVNVELLKNGYVLIPNSDGTFGVAQGDPVAKINNAEYYSLEMAISEAKENDTITLLKDVTGIGITIPGGKKFTIDFAAHTYTATPPAAGSKGTESQAFQLLEGSEIIFKNGRIDCSDYNAKAPMTAWPIQIIIQNYANLTLQNMIIDGTNIAHHDKESNSCLVSTNNGTTEIIGGSIITDSNRLNRDVAFDSCNCGEPYSVPTVTVNGVQIDGAVEVDGGIAVVKGSTSVTGRVDIYNNGQLSVEDGVFSNLVWVGDDKDYLTITGGRFSMIDAPFVSNYVTITGGLFQYQLRKEWGWMPDGYDCYYNTDPNTKTLYPYMVTETKSEEAAVKTTAGAVSFYQTVEEAIKTVSNGSIEYNGATILLLKDAAIETPSGVSFTRESIFDLGGKTLTVANSNTVGNIHIHENVTVRNGYIRTTQESVETKAYSVFEIEADGKILTLQSIDFKAYCPISLARDNAVAVIGDYDGSSIHSNYQVHTLVAASGGDLKGNKKLTINAGDFHITSWAYDIDDGHNAYAVKINDGNFIIGAWNNEAVKAKNETTISFGSFNLIPDEDFVVIPEGSYIIVDNANDAVGCVVSKDKSSAEACAKAQNLTNTNIYYTDLAKTIAAAAEGTTVMLANDVSHSDTDYRVKPNVTVDLAGYLLTCNAYTSQTGGYTMDSTLGVGAICTADREKPSVTIEEDNHGYISIVDPGCGCRFFSYGVRESGPTQDKTDSKKYRIQYVIDIKGANGSPDHSSKAYELMAAGNDVCGLSFVTDVLYREKDYHFKYETLNLMKEYGHAQYNNSTVKAIEAYYILNKCETGDVLEVTGIIKGLTGFEHGQKYKKTF